MSRLLSLLRQAAIGFIALTAVGGLSGLRAQTTSWTLTASGDWSTGSNWRIGLPTVFPASPYTAEISNGFTVSLSQTSSVSTLIVGTSTLLSSIEIGAQTLNVVGFAPFNNGFSVIGWGAC